MTTLPPVIVIGAGGHGIVVADALQRAGREVIGFVDADPATHGQTRLGLPVLGGDGALARFREPSVHLANGLGGLGRAAGPTQGTRRSLVQQRMQADGWHFVDVRHPDSVVSAHATLEPSAQVLAGAVVQPGARVGGGAIVNTRAVVEHDCVVSAFSHVAPGAVMCGNVCVGEQAHVGAGAVVRQGLRIGDRAIVAAGAAVVRDVPADTIVAGVPARAMEQRT
jgi:sugar O-acyltransferase (sialic acid O-acetyltransferase NeuD family)